MNLGAFDLLGTRDLALFVVAGLALNITPGADTLFIVSRAGAHGRAAAMVAALGIGAGCLVHLMAATVGLSALIGASAMAFTVIKWIGAAYLIALGVSMLLARDGPSRKAGPAMSVVAATATDASASLAQVLRQGFRTNVLNPKVALFVFFGWRLARESA